MVLLDQFFFRGEMAPGVRCLYTDGEAWKKLHGFDEMIKHMVAAREDLLWQIRVSKTRLLEAARESFAYSEAHLEEVGDAFIARYGGDKERFWLRRAIRASSLPLPTRNRGSLQLKMELLFEVGQIPGRRRSPRYSAP